MGFTKYWPAAILAVLLCLPSVAACVQSPAVSDTPPTSPALTITTSIPEPTIIAGTPETSSPITYTNTHVTAEPGDAIQSVSGLMVMMNMDDLIRQADTIVVGKVTEIREPRFTDGRNGMGIIYMDVIIRPERFLLGFEAKEIAVRVLGGRIGTLTMIVEDQPEFILGQQMLLFMTLPRNLEIRPPDGFGLADYYSVTGSLQGKWAYNDDKAVDMYGVVHAVSAMEKRISELRPGEQPPSTFVRPAHAGTPLIYFERNYLLGGKEAHLSIYEDGTVILDEAIGTRMAINGFTRCWFTGKLGAEELVELAAYISRVGFLGLPEHYVAGGYATSDLGITIETNFNGIAKKVTSMGYFADSLPDILGNVYDKLIAITYDLKFVGSEHIAQGHPPRRMPLQSEGDQRSGRV